MKYHVIAIAALTLGFGLLHAQDQKVEETPQTSEKERENSEGDRKKPGIDLEAAKRFRDLDSNGDGAVSREEFDESEIASRAEERDPDGNRVSEIFDKIDRNGDDELGLFEFAESFEHRKTQLMDRKVQARFEELDRNGDGFIGRSEFAASEIAENARKNGNAERVSEVFNKIDLNGSGDIGAFEFAYAHENRNKPSMDHETAKKFASLDSNDDGSIGRREFADSKVAEKLRENDNREKIDEIFEEMDRNGNGEIGPREFAKAHEDRDEKGKDQDEPKKEDERKYDRETVEQFQELDRDDDKAISRREFSRSPIAEHVDDRDRVDEIFGRIDGDDDGKLSLKEFAEARAMMRDRPGRRGGPNRDGKVKR
tara:strand:+ start:3788 stop:4894 length:1107 start_codon:yes stop_codon:yes gene_type:complete